MRISLLQAREDFNLIFCETVADYWSSQANQTIVITENKDTSVASEILYAHSYFNFIARRNTPSYAFEALKKEYSYNSSFIKKQLLIAYFNSSIHPVTLPFLSHQKFYVIPSVPESESFIFFGGNTRLRIVYPDRNQTVVLLKKGFNCSYIKNEICFRSKRKLKIAPQWINHDLANGYFTEAYTPGIPINRLPIKIQRQESREEAMLALLNEVVTPTVVTKETTQYVNELFKTIERYSEIINDRIISQEILDIKRIIELLAEQVEGNFKLAFSHGDFQEANIILTKQGVKVIDWETIEMRSVAYDFLTIHLMVRQGWNKKNVFDEVDSFYLSIKKAFHELLNLEWDKEIKKYMILFFLEELVYVLKSSCSPAFFRNGIGLDSKLPMIKEKLKDFFYEKN